MEVEIRSARLDELERLREIENAAGEAFREVGLAAVDEMLPTAIELLEQGCRGGLLFVAEDQRGEVIGFALCELHDQESLHLREVDVAPSFGRRGIGRRLVERVIEEARSRNCRRVTLTTYRDVPWNGPWYRRLGFRELADEELPAWLAELRRRERRAGLDQRPRIAMTFDP